jgi:hypothetical protein
VSQYRVSLSVSLVVGCANRRRWRIGPSCSAKAGVLRQWPGTSMGVHVLSSWASSA